MGFSALTLDRFGYPTSSIQVNQLDHLLGAPVATRGTRLVAWKLLPASHRLLAGVSVADRRSLARAMLDAPRLYLRADADRLTARGTEKEVCASARLTLVNPGTRTVRDRLEISLQAQLSGVRTGYLTINGRRVKISATSRPNAVSVVLPPGATSGLFSVKTAGVRCGSVLASRLASVSAYLDPIRGTA